MVKFNTKIVALIIFCLMTIQCAQTSNIWYVAENGNDTNSGTQKSPFATIEQAIVASRKVKGEKHIIVKEGKYYEVNIQLTPADSGLRISAEEGARPILYGGVALSNWKKEGDYLYAEVKGTKDRSWDFRMILVNGAWRNRARDPELGAFTHLNDFNVRWLSSEAGGWERKATDTERTILKYKPEDIPSDIDVNNAELTIYHEWDESLVGLSGHDKENQILIFENASQHPPGAFAERNPNAQTYVVWNTKEGMHQPGNWYLDRTQERLYYWPKSGENESNIQVIVPILKNIISLADNTKNISIEGLTLSATTTKLVTGGYGALKFEGAISGSRVENISLQNLNIQNIGGWGIKLRGEEININKCEISNIGAGAISYTGDEVRISENKLHDIGLVYFSAVGIFGKGSNNTISNNEIWNMPYCGINGVGHHSIVENNVVHNIKTFMQDGGAIYVFGHKNTIMRNNVVLSNPKSGIKVYAFYLDEGSENCIVENNLAYNTSVPVLAHMTRNCTYQNNIFIDEGNQKIAYSNTSDLKFEKNIMVAESVTFNGPSKDSPKHIKGKLGKVMSGYSNAIGITSWKNNIIHSQSGKIIHNEVAQYDRFNTKQLTEIEGTLFTNPKISGLDTGIIKAEDVSPTITNGIELKDFSNAGYNTNLEKLIELYYSKPNYN